MSISARAAWLLLLPVLAILEALALLVVGVLCLLGPWTQALLARGRSREADDAGAPVLLIHGQMATRGSMLLVGLALRRAGFLPVSIDYRWWAPASDCARIIQETARAVATANGKERVDIVAHSLGGVYASLARGDTGGEHIGRLVTLGTPHGGAGARRWLAPPGARPLLATGTRDKLAADDFALVALSDAVVPPSRAIIEGRTETFFWLGHAGLLVSAAVNRAVVRALRAGFTPSAGPSA